MPGLLAGFDVVVVPSRLDMRALVTIEAMAAGAAIVVSDATAVWGHGDLVEHGVTGLVYPSGDPAALARELGRLLADRALLARIRSLGAQRSAEYGPEAFSRTMAAAARMCLATAKHGWGLQFGSCGKLPAGLGLDVFPVRVTGYPLPGVADGQVDAVRAGHVSEARPQPARVGGDAGHLLAR
jgi:hypothetical protein